MKVPRQKLKCFEFNISIYVVVQVSSCVFFIIYLSYEPCLNILYNFRIKKKKKKKKKKKDESENKNEASPVHSDIDYETAEEEPDINALWKKAKA